MNKKILFVSILSLVMLLTISFASAINMNNVDTDNKESPLFGIRTRRAITEKITNVIDNIRTKFLGERIFFLPLPSLRNKDTFSAGNLLIGKTGGDKTCFTCYGFYSVCVCMQEQGTDIFDDKQNGGILSVVTFCFNTECAVYTCFGWNCR
jgi:hypothetical protein